MINWLQAKSLSDSGFDPGFGASWRLALVKKNWTRWTDLRLKSPLPFRRRIMLTGKRRWLPLAFCLLGVIAHGQEAKLSPGQATEREISGGGQHRYQLRLRAGQFMSIVVEQKGIDVTVLLVAPDGKQLAETNLTGALGRESLSYQARVTGRYRTVTRAVPLDASLKGNYEARLKVKGAPTPQDKQRLAAERLLAEAAGLSAQGAATAAQTVDRAQQALTIWRDL